MNWDQSHIPIECHRRVLSTRTVLVSGTLSHPAPRALRPVQVPGPLAYRSLEHRGGGFFTVSWILALHYRFHIELHEGGHVEVGEARSWLSLPMDRDARLGEALNPGWLLRFTTHNYPKESYHTTVTASDSVMERLIFADWECKGLTRIHQPFRVLSPLRRLSVLVRHGPNYAIILNTHRNEI